MRNIKVKNQSKSKMKVKSFLLGICALAICATGFAQTPEKMSYQAVVRDANNQLILTQNVGIKVSILQGSATGAVAYSETHTVTTNANGLFTLAIGEGTNQSGTFSTIDWGSDNYFLKTEIDLQGGTSYSLTSTQEMMSVPYALYAKTAGNAFSGSYNDLTDAPNLVDTITAIVTDPAQIIALRALLGIPVNLSDLNRDLPWDTTAQQLSRSNDTIYLERGGYVVLPTTATNLSQLVFDVAWDTAHHTLSITGGNTLNLMAGTTVVSSVTLPTSTPITNLSQLVRDVNWDTNFHVLSLGSDDTIRLSNGAGAIALKNIALSKLNRDLNWDTNYHVLSLDADDTIRLSNGAGAIALEDIALSKLKRDLDWDTNYHSLYLNGDTIRLTNDNDYVVAIQHLFINDGKDSIVLNNGGGGIELDSLLKAFNLKSVGLSQFDNDSNFLTLSKAVEMLKAIQTDAALKNQMIDFLMNELDTNAYLRSVVKNWLVNNPNKDQIINLVINELNTNTYLHSVIKDLLINSPYKDQIIDLVINELDTNTHLRNTVKVWLTSNAEQLGNAFYQMANQYITNHPEILDDFIQNNYVVFGKFAQIVLDSLVSKVPDIMQNLGQQILGSLETNLPDLINYIKVQGLDTVIMKYIISDVVPPILNYLGIDPATAMSILSKLPDTLAYYQHYLQDSLPKRIEDFRNDVTQMIKDTVIGLRDAIMQQIKDSITTMLTPLMPQTIVAGTTEAVPGVIGFGVYSTVEIKTYGICFVESSNPLFTLVQCPFIEGAGINVVAGVTPLPAFPYTNETVALAVFGLPPTGIYNVRPFVVTLEGGIIYGPYIENVIIP